MRYFARSQRWRQIFFAACLPYIVVSVLVESFHTTPAGRDGTPVRASLVVMDGSTSLQPGSADESCPACNWLRLGRRLEDPVRLVRVSDPVPAEVAPLIALWPESPIPHPALFRGPPRPVLS